MRRLIGCGLAQVALLMLLGCASASASSPGFTYTDATAGCQTWQSPTGFNGTVSLFATGAGGGTLEGLASGGAGGAASGQLAVTSDESLYLCVNQGGATGGFDGSFQGGNGGGASGIALGSDFSSPLVVGGGGGGSELGNGGNAGAPAADDGAGGEFGGGGGGGGNNTNASGGGGGCATFGDGCFQQGGAGSSFSSTGPGSGGGGAGEGGGGGGGYYGGGGGAGNGGAGGGTDYCDSTVSDCTYGFATAGPSVTIQYLATQTISFPSTAASYGQADFSPASSDSGLTVTYSDPSGQCSIDGDGLVQITGAGSCTITADQGGDDEYAAATSVTQTFAIDQAVVHVDADPASNTYGAADPTATGTLRAADFVNGDTADSAGVTGSASCSISSHSQDVDTYSGAVTCQPGTLSSDDYTFTTGNSADLTINQAVVHVDADPASGTYGSSDPTPTATPRAADFQYTDNASNSGITGTASCSISSHSEDAGTYSGAVTCQPGTLSSTNYSFVAGTTTADLTINPAVLHVDADPASNTYGSVDPTPTGTLRAADFQYSDNASNSGITGTANCSISSHSQNADTYSGAVTCQPGTLSSTNYTFTTGNSADLTINQAVVHVDADQSSKTYGSSDPTPTATLRAADFQYTDNASDSGITGSANCSISSHSENAGTYSGAVTCQPGTLSSANYSFVAGTTTADLTINQAVVHVDADPASKTYGSSDPTPSGTLRSTDFANGDNARVVSGTPSCSIAQHSENAGTYPGVVTCSTSGLSASNYTFTAGNSASLTVLAGAPSVSITAPANGASFSHGENVSADYGCQEGAGGPGISSCAGPVQDGSAIDTSTTGSHSFTVTATSDDGQSTTNTVSYTVTANSTPPDAPSVTIAKPANGTQVTRGPAMDASYNCSDGSGAPGISSCKGTVSNGSHVDTMTLGAHSFSVTATSKDGQTVTKTVTYRVVPPHNSFVLFDVKSHANGTITFKLKLPGAGSIEVLETGWHGAEATTASLKPGPNRFAYTTRRLRNDRPETTSVTIKPNARGARLIKHHRGPVLINLWVTFTPNLGTPNTKSRMRIHLIG